MSSSISFDDDDRGDAYGLGVADESEIGGRIRELRQLRGPLTQEAFAKKLGKTTRGAVGNWERGLGIKRENLLAISEVFGVSFEWLATGNGGMDGLVDPDTHEPVNAFVGDKLPQIVRTIPLYGHAVGGEDGEFVLNGSQLDNITAPPSLSGSKGAYAVTVAGDSMEPRYEDGETVYVDPNRRVIRGNYVVAQIQHSEEGPKLAYIKRFVRHTAKELVLEQFNPPKELHFEHDAVASVHYIVMGGRVT
jgi:phage repressor protein C with HTH and peptisase S24 domain